MILDLWKKSLKAIKVLILDILWDLTESLIWCIELSNE